MVAIAERLRKKKDLEVLRRLRGLEKKTQLENHVKNIMNIDLY